MFKPKYPTFIEYSLKQKLMEAFIEIYAAAGYDTQKKEQKKVSEMVTSDFLDVGVDTFWQNWQIASTYTMVCVKARASYVEELKNRPNIFSRFLKWAF